MIDFAAFLEEIAAQRRAEQGRLRALSRLNEKRRAIRFHSKLLLEIETAKVPVVSPPLRISDVRD